MGSRSAKGKPSGINVGLSPDLKVAEFIRVNGEWNEQRMGEVLQPFEQEAVHRVAIGEKSRIDRVTWKHEPNGHFSVKIAYLLEMGYFDTHPNSSVRDRKAWSRLVWSLSILPKARIFLWRAFTNVIPTPANLKLHHVPTDGTCSLCWDRWGSTEHPLLFYPRIRPCWKETRFWRVIQRAEGLSLMAIGEIMRK